MLIDYSANNLHRTWRQPVVAVNVPEIIAISDFDSCATGLKQSLVLLPDYLNWNIRLRGKAFIDSSAPIGRAVVDNYDFVVEIVLTRYADKTFTEVFLDVVYGNDY